jgi:long-chain acyl-CoA synthetase
VPTLATLLPRIAQRPPESPLITCGDSSLQVGTFLAQVDSLAGSLQARGVGPGVRVGVLHPNGPDAVVAWFAIWRAGAAMVPLNPRGAAEEIAAIAAQTRLGHVLVAPATAASVPPGIAATQHAGGDIRPIEAGAAEPVRAGDDPDVALVQFTSGTTGAPKAVPLRHDTVLAMLESVLGSLSNRAAPEPADGSGGAPERAPMPNLIPISLSLWAGIYNVLFAFCAGAPVVVMPTFEPAAFAEAVRTHGIRSVVLPPAAMVMCTDAADVPSLAPLRYVRSITAPLSPKEAIRFHDKFRVAILNCYGQTELGGEVIGWTAADWKAYGVDKLGAVGRPHRDVDIRIVRDAGDVEGVGELQVRTASTARDGALLDAERSGGDGFVRTGDLARIDADGFVWIVGRRGSMINRGGLKVAPGDVEEAIRGVDGVVDVAVVGAPDRRLGEVPWAFLVWRDGDQPDLPAVTTRCRERLAAYKVPAGYTLIDALPRNEIGKVVSRDLLAMLETDERG